MWHPALINLILMRFKEMPFKTLQETLLNREHFSRRFVKKLLSVLTAGKVPFIIEEKGGNANEKARTL